MTHRGQHVRTVPSDNVDDSKVVEDVHAPSKASSIIDDISVGFETPIIDGSTCLLIVPVMT